MKQTKALALIFVLGLSIIVAGCSDRPPEANIGPEERRDRPAVVTNANTTVNPPATGNVRVADVTGNTNNYIGKTVTVSGWVERSYGANSFRLDEDSVFTGGIDNDLLVVGATNVIPAGMKFGNDDAKVRVTGTVRRVVIADIERDYGFDFDSGVEAEFRDKAVLVANSVQVIRRDE